MSSSEKTIPTQLPNGTGSTATKNSSRSDPDGAFREMFDAMEACSKYKAYYLNAEATGTDLEKVRAQLTEKTKQYDMKEVSYDGLLQKTTDDRERFNREKKNMKAENEALHKDLESCRTSLGKQSNLQADLQRQVQDQKKALEEALEALKKEKAYSAGLGKELRTKENECASANTVLKNTSTELLKWQAYEANLLSLNFESFYEITERLWCNAAKFAHKYFYVDLSPASLERQADWTEEARQIYTTTKLPSFPASNSSAAKSMRMAVALAVLATLISERIFLTTYIEGGGEGLHKLLSEQAYGDDKTVSLCRALLFSFSSPKVQDQQMGRAVRDVEDSFSMFTGRLFDSSQYKQCMPPEYMAELKSLTRQAMSLWQGARRSTVLLDAGLHLANPKKWTAFGSSKPAAPLDTADDQRTGTEPSEEDIELVVFPGIMRTSTGSEETVFPSIVLEKSQMAPVEEELKSKRTEAAARARVRPSGHRRDSLVNGRPFLGTSS